MLNFVKSHIPAGLKRALHQHLSPRAFDRRRKVALLRHAHSRAEVEALAAADGFTYFTDYAAQEETKRREFDSAVHLADVELRGKVVLDVGPGTGYSLDRARDLQAAKSIFIDEEPFFARYAEVRGHTGVIRNYYFPPYFPAAWKDTVDFLYTKGSINCAWVDEQHELCRIGASSGHFDFDEWISELLGLVRAGGSVVLLPSMPRQDTKILDEVYDLDTYFWCPDLEAYKNGHFSRTLERHGFTAHENVAGLTHPLAFPLAFLARKS